MDGIAEARIFHFENSRVRRLSDASLRKIALVKVRTNGRMPLGKGTADAVIAIVAAAKPGLDPRDVTVTDQFGNKFHAKYGYSSRSVDKEKFEEEDKWNIESVLCDWLRRSVEKCEWKYYLPDLQYDGDINVFPEYDVDFDFKEAVSKHKRLSVSIVIHLPFRLTLGGEGEPAPGSEASPRSWKREPLELLTPRGIGAMQRIIAGKFGIAVDDIEIHQVPWNAPERSVKSVWVAAGVRADMGGRMAVSAEYSCELGIPLTPVAPTSIFPFRSIAYAFENHLVRSWSHIHSILQKAVIQFASAV